MIPIVIINDYMFRGNVNAFSVSTAICDSFMEMPKECFHIRQNSDAKKAMENTLVIPSPEDEHIKMILLGVFALAMVILGLFLILMGRHMGGRVREDVFDQVSENVGNYMKIRDQESKEIS